MSTVKTDISTATNTPTRPAFSNLLKHKIGKFHNARKRLSSRSKSSPALMDSKIHPSKSNKPELKRQKSIIDEIPNCQTILDLTILKGNDLIYATRSLISTLFTPIKEDEDIKLDRVSGAMTNAVFFVTIGATKRMLLRVYGVGCDQILDRNKELDWLSRLSQLDIGPKLLGIFGNGRFEEYLPSTTLTRQDIREPQISTQIASRLHQLHSIVETFPPAHNETLEVWANIDKWYTTITTELIPALNKNETWKSQLEALDLAQLGHDIQQCKRVCHDSPIVFAHNDLQYGNILKINGTDELVVIDFEYAGYNPRAVDIANHFCEWMYDYHASDSATMHLDQYPSLQEQNMFLASYLHTQDQSLVMALQKEERSFKWFTVHNVFAFFERKYRASTIQSTSAIETTIKVLGHANILLDITTNDSFKDENEGDAVDSKANNNGTANAVEAKVINGHAEQEATTTKDDVALSLTAKYSKM